MCMCMQVLPLLGIRQSIFPNTSQQYEHFVHVSQMLCAMQRGTSGCMHNEGALASSGSEFPPSKMHWLYGVVTQNLVLQCIDA
jgi:hypothetical protein